MTPDPPGFQAMDECTHQLSLLELATLISEQEGLPEPEHRIDPSLPSNRYRGDSTAFLAKLNKCGHIPMSIDGQIMDTRLELALKETKSEL